MCAAHLIMDSDTQPHCPTCRDSLVELHATDLANLIERVEAIGNLLADLAVHLGAAEDEE